MKIFSTIILSFFFWGVLQGSIFAQEPTPLDTLAPYEKNPYIPTFSILTPDSSWFSKVHLSDKKYTLLFYFSPDCGHCQLETEQLLSKIKFLKKLQVVMITSRSYEDMLHFAEQYKLARFKDIKIGRDGAFKITRFYDVKFTPFSALYNKQGKLVKVYKKGIDFDELISLVNG